jgi:hypothetical protein
VRRGGEKELPGEREGGWKAKTWRRGAC